MANLVKRFQCRACGRVGQIDEIMDYVVVQTELVDLNERGFPQYGKAVTLDGDVDHYQCGACGATVRDSNGDVVNDTQDLVEVLKAMVIIP